VHLLGIVGARRALPELRPLLDHPDRRLRRVAVEAIGAIGDPEGAEAILALLDDRDGRTRFEAARALGAAAGPDTVAALVDELAANEPKDRHAIIEALGAALARLDEAAELDDALAARAREGLAAAARAEDDQLAARAIDALGRWGADEGAPVLASLFTHHHPPRRRAAAHALGGIESDASRAALRRALSGDDETMKAAAAVSLGTVGTSEDVPAIVALARGSRWPTQGAAAFALARLARRGVASADALGPALCELSQKRGPYVRANVATAMAALGLGACPEGPAPADWLDNRRAAPVQAAAARWLAAAAAAGNADPDEARHALDACMDRALSDEVSATCASPGLPALDDEADIYAWSADGRTLLRDRLVALRLSDGSVMLGRTDDNGHVRLGRAPAGRLVLDDPAATPLEPAQNAD
jgi:HEAT repeat protein